mmetsp:Transcript_25044/g.66006  ORF Transcript_25044/g.66006 Transcript_25044/m.66006 type:complete len:210 (-) Transcript_25044:107-736(-)
MNGISCRSASSHVMLTRRPWRIAQYAPMMLGRGTLSTPPFTFKCLNKAAQPSSPISRASAREIPPPWLSWNAAFSLRFLGELVHLLLGSSGLLILVPLHPSRKRIRSGAQHILGAHESVHALVCSRVCRHRSRFHRSRFLRLIQLGEVVVRRTPGRGAILRFLSVDLSQPACHRLEPLFDGRFGECRPGAHSSRKGISQQPLQLGVHLL